MSTVKFENEELVNLSNLLRKLPTITYIKLSEYINKTKKLVNNRTAVIKHNTVTHSEGTNKMTNGSRSQAMPEKLTMTE